MVPNWEYYSYGFPFTGNPFFTPIKAVVCTGFAVRTDSPIKPFPLLESFRKA